MLKQLKDKKRKGFTLVELIVVIAVLLVLAVLAVLAYSNITESARQASLRADVGSLASALNTYNSIVPAPSRLEEKRNPAAGGVTIATGGTPIGTNGAVDGSRMPLSIPAASSGLTHVMDISVTLPADRWALVMHNITFANGIWTIIAAPVTVIP